MPADTSHISGEQTGDPRARMRYSDDGYALGIVKRRRLKLLGWPWYLDIPFGNLSHIGGGQTSLAFLLALFNAGVLRFEPATDEEVELAGRNWTAVLPGSPPMRPPPFCWRKMGRNDMGQTRERPVTNPLGLPLRRERNGPKSAKLILDDDISETEKISSDVESL